MTEDEALEVIVFNQTYPLEEEIIEKCVNKFARQRNLAWVEIRKHRLYPELASDSGKNGPLRTTIGCWKQRPL